jgi:hypothetical protein
MEVSICTAMERTNKSSSWDLEFKFVATIAISESGFFPFVSAKHKAIDKCTTSA